MKAFLERWLGPTSDAINQEDEKPLDKVADNISDDEPLAHTSEAKVYSFQVSDDEIAWRVEAFLQQIPEQGPIPFLVAREYIETDPNRCQSCGETLIDSPSYICGPCSRAKDRALGLAMSR